MDQRAANVLRREERSELDLRQIDRRKWTIEKISIAGGEAYARCTVRYAVMPQPVMMPGVQYCVMQPVPQFQVEQPYAQGMPMQQSYGILPQPTISGLQQNTQQHYQSSYSYAPSYHPWTLQQMPPHSQPVTPSPTAGNQTCSSFVSVQTSNPCGNMPPQSCYSQPCARSASVRASLVANAPTGFERHFMPSRSTSQMAVQSPREQAVCVQQPSGVCMNLSLSVDLPPRSFPVTPTAFQTRAQSEQKQYPAHLPGAVILDDGRLAYLHPHQSHTQVPLGPVPSQPVPRMHFVTTSQTVQPVNRMQIPQFVPQGQPYLTTIIYIIIIVVVVNTDCAAVVVIVILSSRLDGAKKNNATVYLIRHQLMCRLQGPPSILTA
ncbi:unnamed protein product [Toxocara canis]|uniref:R3H domain-containing protein 2 n=1 Tax=Toxocara canis TaxID=6265 RepID=A0A183UKP9_TOXCA|nr:unnamed protein product [Toxocara canis]